MESRTITVEGLRTRVLEESGDGATGDPILLVHGVGGWAENWRAVIGPLAASGRRVVALDLPGFGASARPGRVRYFSGEKAFYPRFVIGAMDVLGFSRAHLGGQSMGGAIVARRSSCGGVKIACSRSHISNRCLTYCRMRRFGSSSVAGIW